MRTRRRLAGCTLAVGAVILAATAAGASDHQNLHGTFRETSTGAGLGYDIAGSAKLTVGSGGTVAKVNISGLDPAKHYSSHLHNQPCATGGGGHYQDVPGAGTTPPNELWLSTSSNPTGGLDPNADGVVHASGTATWEARLTSEAPTTNARSIVVHEPGSGARITCADLG